MDRPDLKRPAPEADDSGSEWEYELDPTEYDTFYVTLDLSHNPNNVFRDRPNKPSNGVEPRKSIGVQAENRNGGPIVNGFHGEEGALADEKIQILDLHTRNPVIEYQSQIYSCEWTQTVGTDLIFAQAPRLIPGTSQQQAGDEYLQPPVDPILTGNGWALLATTTTKLVGHAREAVRRNRKADSGGSTVHSRAAVASDYPVATTLPCLTPEKTASEVASEEADDTHVKVTMQPNENDDQRDDTTLQPVTVPVSISATYEKRAHASFLERFIAAKQKRKETDRVELGRSRTYEDGWKAQDNEDYTIDDAAENGSSDEDLYDYGDPPIQESSLPTGYDPHLRTPNHFQVSGFMSPPPPSRTDEPYPRLPPHRPAPLPSRNYKIGVYRSSTSARRRAPKTPVDEKHAGDAAHDWSSDEEIPTIKPTSPSPSTPRDDKYFEPFESSDGPSWQPVAVDPRERRGPGRPRTQPLRMRGRLGRPRGTKAGVAANLLGREMNTIAESERGRARSGGTPRRGPGGRRRGSGRKRLVIETGTTEEEDHNIDPLLTAGENIAGDYGSLEDQLFAAAQTASNDDFDEQEQAQTFTSAANTSPSRDRRLAGINSQGKRIRRGGIEAGGLFRDYRATIEDTNETANLLGVGFASSRQEAEGAGPRSWNSVERRWDDGEKDAVESEEGEGEDDVDREENKGGGEEK